MLSEQFCCIVYKYPNLFGFLVEKMSHGLELKMIRCLSTLFLWIVLGNVAFAQECRYCDSASKLGNAIDLVDMKDGSRKGSERSTRYIEQSGDLIVKLMQEKPITWRQADAIFMLISKIYCHDTAVIAIDTASFKSFYSKSSIMRSHLRELEKEGIYSETQAKGMIDYAVSGSGAAYSKACGVF